MQEVQSDADYAEVYARSKWRQSRWAPSRIQQVSFMCTKCALVDNTCDSQDDRYCTYVPLHCAMQHGS